MSISKLYIYRVPKVKRPLRIIRSFMVVTEVSRWSGHPRLLNGRLDPSKRLIDRHDDSFHTSVSGTYHLTSTERKLQTKVVPESISGPDVLISRRSEDGKKGSILCYDLGNKCVRSYS